jgi:hypothetical protein
MLFKFDVYPTPVVSVLLKVFVPEKVLFPVNDARRASWASTYVLFVRLIPVVGTAEDDILYVPKSVSLEAPVYGRRRASCEFT